MGFRRPPSFGSAILAATLLHGALLVFVGVGLKPAAGRSVLQDGANDPPTRNLEKELTLYLDPADSPLQRENASAFDVTEGVTPSPFQEVEAPLARRREQSDRTSAVGSPASATRSDTPSNRAAPAAKGAEQVGADPTGQAAEGGWRMDPNASPSEEVSAPAQGQPDAAPIDLGIAAGSWARVMPSAAGSGHTARAPSAPATRRQQVVSTTGGLREALEARDQVLGLGAAGSVLTAARTAAHSAAAPRLGQASFVAVVHRDGRVTVSLASCDANSTGWKEVATAMRDELARKPPAIGPGRAGVEIVLELTAAERWPAGNSTTTERPHVGLDLPEIHSTKESVQDLMKRNPMLVGDSLADTTPPRFSIATKVPGLFLKGRGKVCSYAIGLTPFGLGLGGGCDPSNIGAAPIRVVETRVVRESPI